MTDQRDSKRLERRRQMARQELQGYEDQLSNHELILMRLDALPEELQEPNHEQLRDETAANIERIQTYIDVMREEAGPEKQPVSRQDRRAQAREDAKAKLKGASAG